MFPPFDQNAINTLLLDGVRILFYIGFFLYLIFTFIALRGIENMRKTVVTPFSGVVLFIGISHVVTALLALVFAVITLM